MTTTSARIRARFAAIKERWANSRIGRTIAWYNARGGAQFAGGIAYSAMFSLIAALTIGYSMLNAFLGQNPGVTNAVLDEVQRWVPGLIHIDQGTPNLPMDQIPTTPDAINPTSVIAAVVLLFSALGMMTAMRKSVRAMFSTAPDQEPYIRTKLQSLLGFVLVGVGFVSAAITSVGTEAMGRRYYPGHPEWHWVLPLTAGLLGIPIDALIVGAILRFVAGVRPDGHKQRRDFWLGSIFAGLIATTLRVLSTQVVVFAAGRNLVYLKQAAALVTMLVLVNLLARMLLIVCAWIKNPPRLDTMEYVPGIGEDFFDPVRDPVRVPVRMPTRVPLPIGLRQYTD